MATFNRFNCFNKDMAEKVHDLASDQLTVALTNTIPDSATDTILSDIPQIAYTNASSRDVVTIEGVLSGTSYILRLQDLVIQATGGSVGPFQYLVLYNDAPTSPLDPLIGWIAYNKVITLNNNETLTVNFNNNTLVIL